MMIRRLGVILSLSSILLSFLYASTAIASEIIYSTFGPGKSYNAASGWDVGSIILIPGMTALEKMEAAVSFTPSQNYTFDSLDFAALVDSSRSGNRFTVSLFTDSGASSPEAAVETFLFTGDYGAPQVYSAPSLLHPQLSANEKYWVVMSADDLGAIYMQWLGAEQSVGGEVACRNALSDQWTVEYGSPGMLPAVEVRGTTSALPEPLSLLLLGIGLAGLVGMTGRIGG